MNTKFYVHHKLNYSVAGVFDTKEEAYSYLANGEFKKLVGLQNKVESDFVVDEVAVEGEEKCFIFYHVTKSSNVPSILDKGLIPLRGERAIIRGEIDTALYAFPTPQDALTALEDWFGSFFISGCNCEGECGEGCTKKEIDFTVLSLVLPYDLYVKHISTIADYERIIKLPVPAECIDIAFTSES